MVWVEIGFMDWVLMRGLCLGGLKWVVLGNGVGWSGFYVNAGWNELGWVPFLYLNYNIRAYCGLYRQ